MTLLMQSKQEGFDEVVFDHRNRAYGAYVLRREYPENALKSLLIRVAVIASILLIPYLARLLYHKVQEIQVSSKDGVVDFVVPPEKEKEVIKEKKKDVKPPSNFNSTAFHTFLITNTTVDSLPTSEELKASNPGLFNSTGDEPLMPGDDLVNGPESPIGDDIIKTYGTVDLDRQPEFPGGEKGLHDFLEGNLTYPESAKNIGMQGKVYVTFVINEFGDVTNMKVPREVGGGLDEEALRVIGMMPRWKPGMIKGKPVRVFFKIPIVFKLG